MKFRLAVLLGLALVYGSAAHAQRTIVSGTVTDANRVAYASGSLTATLSLPVGASGAILNGVQIAGVVGPVQLDRTGSFLLNLPDNTQITCSTPQGQIITCAPQTQWTFAITESPGVAPPVGTGPQTCSATLTISGSSQSISSSLNACPALTQLPSVAGTINPMNAPYNAKFDARWKADGALTSGQPTVTSATINFTQADVGTKKIYTINSANGLTRLNSTIASVQSPTSATANANASATESGSGIVVCTDDTAALVAAWNDAIAQNKLLYLPSGATCVTGPLFQATGTSFPRGTNFSVQGSGPGTILIIPPDFNFAACASGGSGGCIFGVSTQQFLFPDGIHSWPQVGNFTVTGLGSICSGCAANTTLFTVGGSGGAIYHDLVVANYCSVQASSAIIVANQEDRIINPNIQGNTCVNTNRQVKPIQVNTGNAAVEIYNPILAYTDARCIEIASGAGDVNVHGGLLVSCGSNPGTNPHSMVSLVGAVNVKFFGTRLTNSSSNVNGWDVDGTSNLMLDGVDCSNSAASGSACLNVQAGGIAKIGRYSQFLTSGGALPITNLGTVFDDGSNAYGTGTSTGVVPTCAMTTGGGAAPACTVIAGSTNEGGTVRMTPGAGPGTNGTTTITFAGTYAGATGTTPSCVFDPANTGTGAWNLAAAAQYQTRSTTAPVFTWNNTVALTAASTYDVEYICRAR